MGLNPIINYAIRGAQLLFGIIVLGLSVDLIRGHEKRLQDLPATLGFAAFVGGISILGALVGVAANWVEILQSIIGAGIDGVIALINLIGGVLIAVKLKGADCGNNDRSYQFEVLNDINILNGGCWNGDKELCRWWLEDRNKLNTRCRQSQADMAFMFIITVAMFGSALLVFLKNR